MCKQGEAAFGAHRAGAGMFHGFRPGRCRGRPAARVGCTQVRGDPFPHVLSLGVPVKEEGRGAVAKRGGKSLQIRVVTDGGKSGIGGNFQKPFLTAIPAERGERSPCFLRHLRSSGSPLAVRLGSPSISHSRGGR